MKLKILLILLFSIILSCANNKILKHKQMADILLDMQLADVYANIIATPEQTQTKLLRSADTLNIYYSSIFKHYNISPSSFHTSYNWYINNPHQLDSVYSIMQNIANKMVQHNDSLGSKKH